MQATTLHITGATGICRPRLRSSATAQAVCVPLTIRRPTDPAACVPALPATHLRPRPPATVRAATPARRSKAVSAEKNDGATQKRSLKKTDYRPQRYSRGRDAPAPAIAHSDITSPQRPPITPASSYTHPTRPPCLTCPRPHSGFRRTPIMRNPGRRSAARLPGLTRKYSKGFRRTPVYTIPSLNDLKAPNYLTLTPRPSESRRPVPVINRSSQNAERAQTPASRQSHCQARAGRSVVSPILLVRPV